MMWADPNAPFKELCDQLVNFKEKFIHIIFQEIVQKTSHLKLGAILKGRSASYSKQTKIVII